MKESELFLPLKDYLESQGYQVRAEVENADIVAVRGEETIIIEMKTSFNLKMVYQLMERQRLTENVYAAVLVNYKTRRGKAFDNMVKLLKRLSVGLIILYKKRDGISVEKVFDPEDHRFNRSRIKEKKLKKEFNSRTGYHNTGGVTREKLVTAYRQNAMKLACALEARETMTTKALREATGIEDAASILQKNYYGWFDRVKRGVYRLSPSALEEMLSFKSAYNEAKSNDITTL